MADHHDAQDYTANGPTDVGFRTGGDNTNITNGVVAHGTEIGVHGIGSVPEGDFFETVGVFGEGITGVKGIGRQADGVGPDISLGVFGQGLTGVRGSSDGDFGVGVDGGSKHTGVKGYGGVVGVLGESSNQDGTGVEGKSDHGIGVNGHSSNGSGIHGSSNTAYGGVFTSSYAQMRLEPATFQGPPKDRSHQKGEFFVDSRGWLYYCVGGTPPNWQRLAGPSLLVSKDSITAVVRSVVGNLLKKFRRSQTVPRRR